VERFAIPAEKQGMPIESQLGGIGHNHSPSFAAIFRLRPLLRLESKFRFLAADVR